MNVLTAIKGIFSAPKAVDTGLRVAEKAADGVIRGLDAIWHTDEEKAADRQLAQETVLKFWEQFAKENSEQSKARREIAFVLVQLFIGVALIGIFLIALGEVQKVNTMIDFLSSLHFGFIIGSIIATYFVPYQVSKVWTKKEK